MAHQLHSLVSSAARMSICSASSYNAIRSWQYAEVPLCAQPILKSY